MLLCCVLNMDQKPACLCFMQLDAAERPVVAGGSACPVSEALFTSQAAGLVPAFMSAYYTFTCEAA